MLQGHNTYKNPTAVSDNSSENNEHVRMIIRWAFIPPEDHRIGADRFVCSVSFLCLLDIICTAASLVTNNDIIRLQASGIMK